MFKRNESKNEKTFDPEEGEDVTQPISPQPPSESSKLGKNKKETVRKYEIEEESGNKFILFVKKYPVVTVFIVAFIIILIILAIVLPLTLVKKTEEKPIVPKCPEGKSQPRIDCLPDKNSLTEAGSNLETVCKNRGCCWSGSGDGGPSCSFAYNYGFRQFKTKENTFSSQWYELMRMNGPNSLAKSDIAYLETRIEMHTDNRLRIRVCFFFILFYFIQQEIFI